MDTPPLHPAPLFLVPPPHTRAGRECLCSMFVGDHSFLAPMMGVRAAGEAAHMGGASHVCTLEYCLWAPARHPCMHAPPSLCVSPTMGDCSRRQAGGRNVPWQRAAGASPAAQPWPPQRAGRWKGGGILGAPHRRPARRRSRPPSSRRAVAVAIRWRSSGSLCTTTSLALASSTSKSSRAPSSGRPPRPARSHQWPQLSHLPPHPPPVSFALPKIFHVSSRTPLIFLC